MEFYHIYYLLFEVWNFPIFVILNFTFNIMNYKTFSLLVLLIARTFLLSSFIITTANFILPENIYACDSIHNNGEPPPCDDDDECCDSSSGSTGCANCEGTPEPILYPSGKLEMLDKPMYYKSAIGPDFDVFLKYTPQLHHVVKNDVGHNWSMLYRSFDLEEKNPTNFWFFYSNGLAHHFEKLDGNWKETDAFGSMQKGTLGLPKHGRSFWISDDRITAVISTENENHYGFELVGETYRLAWAADKFGDKMSFHYSTNLPGIFDYVLTADNKKFNFNYHFGITNYPDNLKNGKIESIEGPFTAADIEIPNITRKILFTYEIRYEIYKTDDKYYILLDSVTDMANRTFEYDYALANQNLVTSLNWNVSLSEVKGPQGHTTSIKYQQEPFKITVFYPDSSWETVSFNGIANFYYADYWNSQQGSALNPVSSKKFTYSYNGWMLDEYEGKVDSLGRRTTNKKLSFSGVGDVFTTNRPYLAWKTFEKTISDKNNNILEETYFQYYKNPAETGLLQNQLTDLYQKWGYPYKITKFDANGDTNEVTIYEDLSVDINGALLGRTIITKDGNGNILSESKEFSKQQNWRAETIADWPSGFSFTYTILLTNSGQKTSITDWAEKRYFYNASGKILSEKIRIDNTGNDSLDFIISKFYTYYADGTGSNRLSATYFPAENPIIESNITGGSPDFTGLKKNEFVYDEAGRIITENIYFFKEHSSLPFQSVDYQYDSLDRKIQANYSDGDIELWSYSASCCGIATHRNRDGITTLYGRDLRARPTRETVFSPRATILSDTSYKLDFNGNVIKKTDASGGISTYEYDEADRLISQTDSMGGKTLYGYDLFDKRIFTVFPNGLTERIFYDENNNPIHKANYASLANAATNSLSITNSLPLTANDGQPFIESYNFSVAGYLEMKFGPYKHSSVSPFSYNTNNFSEKYSYDLSGRKLKTVTDDGAAGFYSRNEYEPRGLLTKSVGPVVVGATETAADINKQNFYNSAGLLKFSVSAPYIETDNPADKKRRVTKYNYDFRLNKISETKIGTMDAALPVTLANLDAVTFTTVAASDFDTKGRVITNYQEGISTKFSYTKEDNYELTTQTFPDGSTSKTFFDGNRISKIIDRNGIIKLFEYDAAGNRIKEMKNEKLIMKNCFDLLGRLTSVSNALNEATFYNYDSMGNQTKIIFPDGQFQTRQYNLLNQLVSVDGANTYPLTFDYNALGRKIQMTDGNGSKTKWSFDILSRLKYKCYDGHTTNAPDFEYFYDISGRLISRKDKKNILTKYWYDNIGRMRGVDYPDPTQKSNLSDFISTAREGMDIRYTFDFLGRRTKMEDITGTNSYSYETVSSRIILENGQNAKIQRTYDSSGNIDKLFIGETEATAVYLTDYNYTAGTLNSIQSSVFSLPSSVSSNQYFYNNSGRKIKLESFAWETDHWKLATIQNWTYDNADRILSVTNLSVNSATSVASFFNYSLDKQGRRTNCFKNSPFSKGGEGDLISYEYNPRSELISADLSSDLCPLSSEFSYDPIGNRLLERQNDLLIQGDYNSWNQLTNRFFHGDIGYFGTATTTNSRNLTYLFVDGTNLISSTTNKHEFRTNKKIKRNKCFSFNSCCQQRKQNKFCFLKF